MPVGRHPASGYASESEVIRDGLRALRAQERAIDHWLRTAVVPAYEALKGDPSRGVALEDVRIALAERHASMAASRPAPS